MPADKFKVNQQYALAVKKTKYILICISKTVPSRLREAIHPFCSALVRLHLKYRVHFQAPWYTKKVRKEVEQAQQKAPMMIRFWISRHREAENAGLFSFENRG